MLLTKILIAAAAVAGTAIQTYQVTVALGRMGLKVGDAVAVEELRTEHSVLRHPLKWLARQREIWALLNPRDGASTDIIELRDTYRELSLHIWGWALLMGAAGGGLGLAVVGG